MIIAIKAVICLAHGERWMVVQVMRSRRGSKEHRGRSESTRGEVVAIETSDTFSSMTSGCNKDVGAVGSWAGVARDVVGG